MEPTIASQTDSLLPKSSAGHFRRQSPAQLTNRHLENKCPYQGEYSLRHAEGVILASDLQEANGVEGEAHAQHTGEVVQSAANIGGKTEPLQQSCEECHSGTANIQVIRGLCADANLLEEVRRVVGKLTAGKNLTGEADTSDLSSTKFRPSEAVPVRCSDGEFLFGHIGANDEGEGFAGVDGFTTDIDLCLLAKKSTENLLRFGVSLLANQMPGRFRHKEAGWDEEGGP